VEGSPTLQGYWRESDVFLSLEFLGRRMTTASLPRALNTIKFGGGFERMMLNVIADTDPTESGDSRI